MMVVKNVLLHDPADYPPKRKGRKNYLYENRKSYEQVSKTGTLCEERKGRTHSFKRNVRDPRKRGKVPSDRVDLKRGT